MSMGLCLAALRATGALLLECLRKDKKMTSKSLIYDCFICLIWLTSLIYNEYTVYLKSPFWWKRYTVKQSLPFSNLKYFINYRIKRNFVQYLMKTWEAYHMIVPVNDIFWVTPTYSAVCSLLLPLLQKQP